MRPIPVPISPGELIDKISILQIKAARVTDAAKRANIRAELELLEAARARYVPAMPDLHEATRRLNAVNESLWEIEDEIRAFERRGDFGEEFVRLARSVYRQNDERAAIKRRINELLGSQIIEEKSYASYGR